MKPNAPQRAIAPPSSTASRRPLRPTRLSLWLLSAALTACAGSPTASPVVAEPQAQVLTQPRSEASLSYSQRVLSWLARAEATLKSVGRTETPSKPQ